MQRLHPNALWLFWLRALLGVFPGSRKTGKFAPVVLVIVLYAVVISYAVFSLSQLTTGVFGGGLQQETGISAWWQDLSLRVNIGQVTVAISVVFAAFLVLTFLRAYVYYRYYGYEVDQNSLRVRKGVLSIHEAAVPFEKIENVDIFRGILHRMLGLSSIYIQTAGYSESTEAVLERHPGFVSEASIDGVSVEEAERIRRALMKKNTPT